VNFIRGSHSVCKLIKLAWHPTASITILFRWQWRPRERAALFWTTQNVCRKAGKNSAGL